MLKRQNKVNLDEVTRRDSATPDAAEKKELDAQRARLISLVRSIGLVAHRDFECAEQDGFMPLLDAVMWLACYRNLNEGSATSDTQRIRDFDDAAWTVVQLAQAGRLHVLALRDGSGELEVIRSADFSGINFGQSDRMARALQYRVDLNKYLELVGPAEDSEPSGGRYQDKLYLDGDINPTWTGLRIENKELLAVASNLMPSSRTLAQGGRPTDRELIKAEAQRRLEVGERSSSLTAFARELRDWLVQHQGAVRDSNGQVMRVDTIKRHVRPLYRKN